MKSISVRLLICGGILCGMAACSPKNEPKAVDAGAPRPKDGVVQAPVQPPLAIDAPAMKAEVSPLMSPEARLNQGVALTLDAQEKAPVLLPSAFAEGELTLDPAHQAQVVQTPGLRLEARAQAMKEMRWDRAQQK